MKVKCPKCSRLLGETEFYRCSKPYSHRRDYSACAECKRQRSRERWQRIKNDPIEIKKQRLYRQKNRKRILEGKKEYYQANRERIDKKNKEWARKNKNKRKEICRRWARKKRKKDPTYFSRMNKRCREWKLAYTRRYRKENRAWYLAQKLKRRVRELSGDGITEKDILAQLKKQGAKCFYCGIDIADTYTIDHKVSLAKNGLNSKENMVLACRSCNCRKNTKSIEEFIALRDGIKFLKSEL